MVLAVEHLSPLRGRALISIEIALEIFGSPPAFHLDSPGPTLVSGRVIGSSNLSYEAIAPMRIREKRAKRRAAHEMPSE